jgi:hypothetical protein
MDALMGAYIFEEAYNVVLHMGEQAYGGKGRPQSILDYRWAAHRFCWHSVLADTVVCFSFKRKERTLCLASSLLSSVLVQLPLAPLQLELHCPP